MPAPASAPAEASDEQREAALKVVRAQLLGRKDMAAINAPHAGLPKPTADMAEMTRNYEAAIAAARAAQREEARRKMLEKLGDLQQ